jgi:hypothetical protein
VLPGDVKQTGGPVTILDVIAVRNAQLTSFSYSGYSALDDVDGSGSINILDVVDVRNRQLTSLPVAAGKASATATVEAVASKIGAVPPAPPAVAVIEAGESLKTRTLYLAAPPAAPLKRLAGKPSAIKSSPASGGQNKAVEDQAISTTQFMSEAYRFADSQPILDAKNR